MTKKAVRTTPDGFLYRENHWLGQWFSLYKKPQAILARGFHRGFA